MSKIEFTEFPKISRLNREIIITEKIDGTNSQVHIRSALENDFIPGVDTQIELPNGTQGFIRAGSRNRWVTEFDDNFGFAKWVNQNASELAMLGLGRHFGEWWGMGIQRKYGLNERRFSLFNVLRWAASNHEAQPTQDLLTTSKQEQLPKCCYLVPILYRGLLSSIEIASALDRLRREGSVAAPGFAKPEGIVVFHVAGNVAFKQTLEKDDVPKSKASRN